MRLYFPHIEGLRFVAALLVAIYHIWTARVSGGVDVFFVVSGLLVTLTLLRQVEKTGKVDFISFFAGLALRLFPAALLVLMLVLVGTFLLLPATQHLNTVREIIAAMLYFENWQLAVQAIDYLDRENPPSPVQHFWAMSVQGQFYVYAALLFLASLAVSRKLGGIARSLMFVNGAAIGLSLAYSVYQTHFGDQVWAYFDTFARIWEFGFGATLALILSRKPTLSLPLAFGWLGLIAVLICGMAFNVADVFPGLAALFPTTAALLVVLGGRSDSAWSVQSLLGSRAMVSLGSVSYGIYLFHWPLLIFYQQVTGIRPSLVAGVTIIAVAIALAYLTRHFVERPILALKAGDGLAVKLRTAALCFGPAFAVTLGVYATVSVATDRQLLQQDPDKVARPLTLMSPAEVTTPPAKFTLSPEVAKRDRAASFDEGCHTNQQTDTAIWCTYGVEDGYSRTLAMVGGSHTAHWLPALQVIAEKNNWRILYSTWSGCRFNIEQEDDRCRAHSLNALHQLSSLQPDLVFTSASVMRATDSRDRYTTWGALQEAGIPVIAARGTPRFGFSVPDCLSGSGEYLSCGRSRNEVLAKTFESPDAPDNVTIFDVSEYLCNDEYCPPAADGTILYFDGSHITATYMRMLAEVIATHLVPAMEQAPERHQSALADLGIVRADLYCSAWRSYAAQSRTIMISLEGNSLSYKNGDWQEKAKIYELWSGNIDGDVVSISGTYRSNTNAKENKLELLGTLNNGTLIAAGKRSARTCSLIAHEVTLPDETAMQ